MRVFLRNIYVILLSGIGCSYRTILYVLSMLLKSVTTELLSLWLVRIMLETLRYSYP